MKTLKVVRITAALAVLMAAGAAAAAEKAGDVVSVRGKAQIERQGGRSDARIRDALQESDSVVTKDKARLKMLFRDDSVLTLGANSRLNIRKYLYSPENKRAESIYELADGRLRSVAGGPGFKVTTPTAFAAARGTVFSVSYDAETGTTEISVLEGAVEVRNINDAIPGSQVVVAGQSTTVAGNKPPTTPVRLDTRGGKGRGGDDGGGGLPEVEIGDGHGLLHDLHDKLEHGGLTPPIEQEPAHATTKVNLNVRFR